VLSWYNARICNPGIEHSSNPGRSGQTGLELVQETIVNIHNVSGLSSQLLPMTARLSAVDALMRYFVLTALDKGDAAATLIPPQALGPYIASTPWQRRSRGEVVIVTVLLHVQPTCIFFALSL